MPKVKVPRKSTNIDMTAMCDVAFLLLSFFILATKTKPAEVLSVLTPNSVSTKIAPEKDVVLVTIDSHGKVFFSVSDNNAAEKEAIITEIGTSKGLNLTDAQKKSFKRANSFIGVPFSQLPSYLNTAPEDIKNIKMDGIPVTDSANNQLYEWMLAAKKAFEGKHMELMVKGDNSSRYPSFQGVINAFKRNDLMKFSMVTNPEAPPVGSELYKANQIKAKEGPAQN